MRPLVVLLLVVAALGALFFALTTLSNAGRRGQPDKTLQVAPAQAAPKPETMVDPVVPPPKGEEKPEAAQSRQALPTALSGGGPTVRFGAIEGAVVDEEGNPIAGATVSLLNTKPTSFGDDAYILKNIDPPRPVAKFETEAEGTFRFDRLDPRKDWSLTVVHERYLRWESGSALPVREDETWQERVMLKTGVTFSGFVRDAQTGQGIPNATLVSESPLARSSRRTASQLKVSTDATGAYVFNNPASSLQARTLTVSAPGYATQVHLNFQMVQLGEPPKRFTNVQRDPKLEAKTQDFALEPGKVIAGRVLAPDHNGAPGVEVEALNNQTGTIGSQGSAKSKANGEFLIEGLAEGIYTVRVVAEGQDANALQRVEAGETGVVLQLFELASVTGMVIDPDGRPLSNFEVKARAANEVSKAFGAVLAKKIVKGSKDGAFELDGLPEGSYVIEALAEGYCSSFSEQFPATQGLVTSDIVVRMTRGGSISGFVLDSYENMPIVGAEVITQDNNWIEGDLFELFGAMEPSALTKAKVYTDERGAFRIETMTPDTYQVQIKAKNYAPVFVNEIVVVDGQNTALPTQALSKGAVITGMVYGRDSAPAPGATVNLMPADQGDVYGSRTTRADANGRFLIEHAIAGKYQLSATRPDSNTGGAFEAIGDMNQSKIEISIEDGGKYEFDLSMSRTRR